MRKHVDSPPPITVTPCIFITATASTKIGTHPCALCRHGLVPSPVRSFCTAKRCRDSVTHHHSHNRKVFEKQTLTRFSGRSLRWVAQRNILSALFTQITGDTNNCKLTGYYFSTTARRARKHWSVPPDSFGLFYEKSSLFRQSQDKWMFRDINETKLTGWTHRGASDLIMIKSIKRSVVWNSTDRCGTPHHTCCSVYTSVRAGTQGSICTLDGWNKSCKVRVWLFVEKIPSNNPSGETSRSLCDTTSKCSDSHKLRRSCFW